MAQMIPTECDPQTRSKGEITVYNQLRKAFDDSWTIFHSFDITSHNVENRLVDFEIDFLLFHPEKGILILEVKGGKITISENGWFQNGHVLNPDPVAQAKRNKYGIKDYLEKYLHGEPPISFGHSICFPDVFDDICKESAELKHITIIGSELSHINEAVISIMNNFHKEEHSTLDKTMEKTIRKALLPVFELGSSLIDKFGQAERVFFSLTEEQLSLLDFISNQKNALIEGCAGSGKTVMAIKKAKQLAENGQTVLLMCYNILLANNLRQEIKGYEDKIVATTYHQFCTAKLHEANVEFSESGSNPKFWTEYVPKEFAKLIKKKPIKFDAIIIDEAQDFQNEYWTSINKLLVKGGYYYIFYDKGQNLYGTELKLPNLGNPYQLKRNCRNTKTISDEVKKYSSVVMESREELPTGEPIYYFESNDALARRGEINRILNDLITNKGINENQIVLLGGHKLSKTCLGASDKMDKFKIVENGESDKYQIPYFTYMKYKGCNSDIVILVDFDEADHRWNTDMAKYTAFSRAKHLLYVVKKTQ